MRKGRDGEKMKNEKKEKKESISLAAPGALAHHLGPTATPTARAKRK